MSKIALVNLAYFFSSSVLSICFGLGKVGMIAKSIKGHRLKSVFDKKRFLSNRSTLDMFKLLRPKITYFASDLSRLHDPSPYKRWYELSLAEKQFFVSTFRVIFRNRYPASGTNSTLHLLSRSAGDHHDSPSVFGIFYEDIWKVENRTGRDNHRFSDQAFRSLLVRRRI